jgi:hypothetical protein
MTAQIPETLILSGHCHRLCTEPLSQYFMLANLSPKFSWTSTALWRGYEGTWEILEDRLYLVALEGSLQDGTNISLETFFPGFPERAFAHWYCGRLRVPQGVLIDYVHGGYLSRFEQDLFLEISRGVVVTSEIGDNREQSPKPSAQHRTP